MIRRVGRPGLIGMAARTAVVAGTATAVSGHVERRQQERAQQQTEEAAAAQVPQQPAGGSDDVVSQLSRLADLHAQGILSDQEFATAKGRLLS